MQAQTVGDVIRDARIILADTNTALQRFSDDMFTFAVFYGLNEMDAIRPDLFLDWMVPDVIDVGTSLVQLDARYRPALVDYVCYWIEWQDTESTDASRSSMHYSSFMKKMGGRQL